MVRRLHLICTALVALQFLIWVGTGVAFSWTDFDLVRSTKVRAPAVALPSEPPRVELREALAKGRDALGGPVVQAHLKALGGRAAYVLAGEEGASVLVDAESGIVQRTLSMADAAAIAAKAHGAGLEPRSVLRLLEGDVDAKSVELPRPVFRACYDDGQGTCVYVDEKNGEVVAYRNDAWVRFDRLFSLHTLAYVSRDNPAHGPMRVLSGLASVAVLSGIGLGLQRLARRRGALPPASSESDASPSPGASSVPDLI